MSRGIHGETSYSNTDTLSVAGTGELVGSGANTFAAEVRYIAIHASAAIYVAKDSTNIASAAAGAADDREYIPATTLVTIPWRGLDMYFVDVSGSDTPTIYVTGWA